MILTVIVIGPMKMASVTTYGFDDYGIDHGDVPDDVGRTTFIIAGDTPVSMQDRRSVEVI
jgi:hypothetical protein